MVKNLTISYATWNIVTGINSQDLKSLKGTTQFNHFYST